MPNRHSDAAGRIVEETGRTFRFPIADTRNNVAYTWAWLKSCEAKERQLLFRGEGAAVAQSLRPGTTLTVRGYWRKRKSGLQRAEDRRWFIVVTDFAIVALPEEPRKGVPNAAVLDTWGMVVPGCSAVSAIPGGGGRSFQ